MQYLSVYTLVIGKLCNGFFVTVVNIASVKMISESLPVYMDEYGIMAIMIPNGFGYFLVQAMGAGLPQNDYNPELLDDKDNLLAQQADINDHFWRIMYGFPILINLLMLSIFMIFIKDDPIMYSLSIGNEEKAINLIAKIYDEDP